MSTETVPRAARDFITSEIVGQEGAEVVDACVDSFKLVDSERVSHGKYTLRAVVHVFAIFVFEIYGLAAWNHVHFDVA